MYPALELYPRRDRRERMIMTNYSVKLVQKFCEYCRKQNIVTRETGKLIGLKGNCVCGYQTGDKMPYIETYLRIRKLVGCQVGARDINYAYAMVSYPPEEIKRRLKRLKKRSALVQCAEDYGVAYTNLCEAANYCKGRTAISYWRLMTWIAAKEKERGYDDALKFYK